MKNMFLCAMMILSTAIQCISQQHSTSQNVLHVKIYDNKGQVASTKDYQDQAALGLNLEKLINENSSNKMLVHGAYIQDGVKHYVYYHHRGAEGDYCRKETTTLKPIFGISGHSNANLTGLIVEEVLEGSPADMLGLISGDVVYNLGEHEIVSYCDLHMAVRSSEVGDELTVEYSKNGRMLTNEVTIGAKPQVNVTFEACKKAVATIEPSQVAAADVTVADFNVYPNPTKSMTFLKYESNSDEPLEYYILDSQGKLIHREQVTFFSGNFRTDFAFNNHTPGIYYFVVEQGELREKKSVLYIGN